MIKVYELDTVYYVVFDSVIENIDSFITLPENITTNELFSYLFSTLAMKKSLCLIKGNLSSVEALSKRELKNYFAKHFYIDDEFITLSPSLRGRLKDIVCSDKATFKKCHNIISSLPNIS